jgi:hypothetical protein
MRIWAATADEHVSLFGSPLARALDISPEAEAEDDLMTLMGWMRCWQSRGWMRQLRGLRRR